jgi:DMSO/TMAO reductase YedYZ molybdopterin-dependent catalytic subunit
VTVPPRDEWNNADVTDDGLEPPRALPPGQRLADGFPVHHYGPVPRFKPDSWRLTVTGATADGVDHHLTYAQFCELPRTKVHADMHCASRWSLLDNTWEGVATRTLLDVIPPADDCVAVMAWAEYGYSANLRLEDFTSPRSIMATHRNGEPLTPEHGWPLRLIVPHLYTYKGPKWLRQVTYLTEPARGFWEERGYHAVGDAWREERYSYQE